MIANLAERFGNWIATQNCDAEPALSELAALDPPAWIQFARSAPSLMTADVVRQLIRRADSLLASNPARALPIAFLATRIADAIKTITDDEVTATSEILGDANKAWAAALYDLARYAEADEASQQAAMFYSLAELDERLATLNLLRGKILHRLGRQKEALQIIELSANVLLSYCGNVKKYVEGRTIQAGLLLHDRRYVEAAAILNDSIAYAQEEKDTILLAHIVDLTAACHFGLGEYATAKECLKTAKAMFEALGMTRDVLQVREGLVHIMLARGNYNAAVAEQFSIRNELLKLNMPVAAAIAGLDAIAYLFLAGRLDDVGPLCAEMIGTFVDARLPDRALRALAYLNELAQRRAARPDDVTGVKMYLGELRDNPLAEFPFERRG